MIFSRNLTRNSFRDSYWSLTEKSSRSSIGNSCRSSIGNFSWRCADFSSRSSTESASYISTGIFSRIHSRNLSGSLFLKIPPGILPRIPLVDRPLISSVGVPLGISLKFAVENCLAVPLGISLESPLHILKSVPLMSLKKLRLKIC